MRVLLLICALLCTLPFGVASCRRDAAKDVFAGVRLGMTPRDVRSRFEGGSEGSWQTKFGGAETSTDDTTMVWMAGSVPDPKSLATMVRFEFHQGMLVAIRGHLRVNTLAESADVTPNTVTVFQPGSAGVGGTEVVVLVRDCPTHRDEAASLVAKAARF